MEGVAQDLARRYSSTQLRELRTCLGKFSFDADTPLREIPSLPRIKAAELENRGARTLTECALFHEEELARDESFGESTLSAIRKALNEVGMDFKPKGDKCAPLPYVRVVAFFPNPKSRSDIILRLYCRCHDTPKESEHTFTVRREDAPRCRWPESRSTIMLARDYSNALGTADQQWFSYWNRGRFSFVLGSNKTYWLKPDYD